MNLADVDFENLELKDVIVLRFKGPLTEAYGEMGRLLGEKVNRLVIVLDQNTSLETLDEHMMQVNGWIKET